MRRGDETIVFPISRHDEAPVRLHGTHHRPAADTSVRVHLLEHLVDIGRKCLHPLLAAAWPVGLLGLGCLSALGGGL